jgi:hypothetical protein
MKRPKPLRTGAIKRLSRVEAIEEYILFRIRAEEVLHLDYLLNVLHDGLIKLPVDSRFSCGQSTEELKNTIRTCFMGWFASLMDRDSRAIYAFDCLFVLFGHRKPQIISAQLNLEACREKLQQFRNNVAFHARANASAQIRARMALQEPDFFADFVFAIKSFGRLIDTLKAEELDAIPELPGELQKLRLTRLPTFSKYKKKAP